MFDTEKNSFYKATESSSEVEKDNVTFSGNGALKFSTSGNPFVDDFMTIAHYRNPRPIKDVFETMRALWSIDPITTLKESVYLRMITRDTKLFEGTKLKVQRGQGLRAEFFSRMMWLAVYHPNTFKKNLPLFVAAGSWDDIFEMLRIDLSYEHDGNKYKRALDWKFMTAFIIDGLNDENQSELVKKYLPNIKAAKFCTTKRSQCNNYIAKYLAKLLFYKKNEDGTETSKEFMYTSYSKLKSSGTAHEWQKLISQGKFEELNFDNIPGRALTLLANSQFLVNQGLEEKFTEWILSKNTAKFTGFVYELFTKPATKDFQKALINKQFEGLLETVKAEGYKDRFICCLDTSGSMSSSCYGLPNNRSIDVAKSIALYFSYFLDDQFKDSFLEFSSDVTLRKWEGETPYDKFWNMYAMGWGSTNFIGVAKLFANMKGMGVPEEVFPTGVVCISDGEFDRCGDNTKTNFEQFLELLRQAGFSEDFVSNFKIVLWDIPNTFYGSCPEPKFESSADAPNFFYLSGFDPAGITFLLGKAPEEKPEEAPKTAEELFRAAMNQELLNLLRI